MIVSLRLFINSPLAAGPLSLPHEAVRHLQVRRLQPGDALVLFDGRGGEWPARVREIGRREALVDVLDHVAVERELPVAVTLAVGMPANERMDGLVEKAAELGATVIQPLHTSRSVLRLAGERAQRRQAHWQGIAIAACEQCGRTAVPRVEAVRELGDWLAVVRHSTAARLVFAPGTMRSLRDAWPAEASAALMLSGPEGGLAEEELAAAANAGFTAVGLGERVLRADTAPLAALAWIGLHGG